MKRTTRWENRNGVIDESCINSLKLRPVGIAVRASLFGLVCGVTNAATIVVTSSADAINTDSGSTCTLRKAVESINQRGLKPGCVNTAGAFGNNDTIELMPELSGSTITLAGEELLIDGGSTSVDLTLHGSNITINPDSRSRGFRIARDNALVINNLTISNGSQSDGGAVSVEGTASLSANNVTFSDNQVSSDGGAIRVFNSGNDKPTAIITLNNCTVSGNRAGGGGAGVFVSGGDADIYDSTISGNTVYSNSGGGGLYLQGGQFVLDRVTVALNQSISNERTQGGGLKFTSRGGNLKIANSTIYNNLVRDGGIGGGGGGGLALYVDQAGFVTISNSTISSNSVDVQDRNNPNLRIGSGAGINLSGQGSLILENTTVFKNRLALSANNASNEFAAGIELTGNSSMQTVNSIIARTVGGFDCHSAEQSTVTADSFNIIQDGSCMTSARAINPRLSALADNGGSTKTHLPISGSPAIDGGDNRTCQPSDQRGKLRPRFTSNACDVGAVEVMEGDLLEERMLFVVPSKNGQTVIFEL